MRICCVDMYIYVYIYIYTYASNSYVYAGNIFTSCEYISYKYIERYIHYTLILLSNACILPLQCRLDMNYKHEAEKPHLYR